jgi:sugar/nucleoside kinase (ribokinase family)
MATQFLTHSVVAMGAFVLGRLCQQQQQHGAAVDHRGSTTATATRGDAQSDEVVESSVVCAGHACIDVVMEQCDELSSREGYAAVERFQLTPGGAVSNTAMQLASLGVTVEAMTVLGNDDFGRLLREAWRQAGVRADKFVQLTDDAPTSCAALPVYKADSKRAVYACPGSNTTIDGEMLLPRAPNGGPDYAMLAAHKFFVLGYPHIMPKLQGSSLRAFLVAVARHCAVALDVNEAYDHPQLPLGPRGRGTAEGKEVFAPVAVLHCNLEEAAACLNRKAVRHAVQIDQAFHCV